MFRKLLWLAPLALLLGCASSSVQPQITRFDPIMTEPQISSQVKFNEVYASYEADTFNIAAAIFEYQSLYVLPLEIANKTDKNIEPSEYSVSLHDGRDLKLIRMLTLDDLIAVKNKMTGKSSGGIESQIISTTVNTIMSLTSLSSQGEVMRGLDMAIDNYFSFRPIYKHETRKGILCFMINFRAEYPITLLVKLRGEEVKLKFMPRKDN